MPGYGVYYEYDGGEHEWIESFSDSVDAYKLKRELQAEIDADEDAEDTQGVRVVVREEM